MSAPPSASAANAVMTMVTTGSLMSSPEPGCSSTASPPADRELAAMASLPHVAAVTRCWTRRASTGSSPRCRASSPNEESRELSPGKSRSWIGCTGEAGEPSQPDGGRAYDAARRVAGGDVVLIVDGWANFGEAMPAQTDAIVALMRARNYGVRVVVTPHQLGLRVADRAEERVPSSAWRWCSPTGGPPSPPHRGAPAGPGGARQAGPRRRRRRAPPDGGDPRAAGCARRAGAGRGGRRGGGQGGRGRPRRRGAAASLIDCAAGGFRPRQHLTAAHHRAVQAVESTSAPAYVDFAEAPHIVAVGQGQSGRPDFLHTMYRAIILHYSADEATIAVLDPGAAS